MPDPGYLDRIAREMLDQGRLLQAGWVALRTHAIGDKVTDPATLDLLRLCYFAGADHIFGSMMGGLDPDDEPTPADMRRLNMLQAELRRVRPELTLWMGKPGGQG